MPRKGRRRSLPTTEDKVVAEWAAAGVCVGLSAGTCAGALVVVFGVSTYANQENASVFSSGFWKSEGLTAMETFLAGGAGVMSAVM